jgi:hypothetical protein
LSERERGDGTLATVFDQSRRNRHWFRADFNPLPSC